MAQEDVFKKIVSHCKEYGFVFPSSEIYDGLAAVYDYGQNGVELKNNIKQYWWKSMVLLHDNIVGIDSAIFMHPTIWKASGHVDAFNDPLIDNRDSKKRYRADVSSRTRLRSTTRRSRRRLPSSQALRRELRRGSVPRHQRSRNRAPAEARRSPRTLYRGYAGTGPRRAEADHHRRGDRRPDQRHKELDRRAPVQSHVLYRDGLRSRRF